ncbi:MAG: hypothetical protein SGJ24_09155, partial [Chloroflexota bacterium]|nr:hypothetical protein [Chloroflexota bacterium]
ASAEFWLNAYRGLLPRVQNGEIRLIFVPLVGQGDIPGGRLAARAAICAGDQGRFWQYADRAFAQIIAAGADAFTGDFLDRAARDTGLDLRGYQECTTLSDGPDAILRDAELAVSRDSFFSRTPFVKLNESPTLTDLESLNFAIDVQLTEANEDVIAAQSTPTPDPEATEEAEPLVVDAVTGQQIAPPITLTLPDGWQTGLDVLVLQDIDAIRNIPFAVYTGAVSGGTGTIVLLWGFPNLLPASAVTLSGEIRPEMLDLYLDGTRLLRVAVVEQGCNIGTDIRRSYSIGGLEAIGTGFAAVDCPQLTDTRGWFAGLRQYELNFVFYAFVEPIAAFDAAQADLQAILDTAQFALPPTPAPTPAP